MYTRESDIDYQAKKWWSNLSEGARRSVAIRSKHIVDCGLDNWESDKIADYEKVYLYRFEHGILKS